MMLENADYFVHLVDFPVCSAGGIVLLNDDGTYTVLLNSRLSREKNADSLKHEITHIEKDDLYRDDPISQIEAEAG